MAKLKTFIDASEEEINNFIANVIVMDFNRYNNVVDIIYDEVVE